MNQNQQRGRVGETQGRTSGADTARWGGLRSCTHSLSPFLLHRAPPRARWHGPWEGRCSLPLPGQQTPFLPPPRSPAPPAGRTLHTAPPHALGLSRALHPFPVHFPKPHASFINVVAAQGTAEETSWTLGQCRIVTVSLDGPVSAKTEVVGGMDTPSRAQHAPNH